MNSTPIIAAVDIGSATLRFCVGQSDGTSIRMLASVIIPTRGFTRGIVHDLKNLTDTIADALERIEEKTQLKIRSVYVSISGSHVEGHSVTGATLVSSKGKRVKTRDVYRCCSHAKVLCLPIGRQIVHEIPIEFAIDNNEGINNPLGLYASHLKGHFLLVSADRVLLHNVVMALNRAGLEVERVVMAPYASALGVLTTDETRQTGVVIDLGAASVGCAVMRAGKLLNASISVLDEPLHDTSDDMCGCMRQAFCAMKQTIDTTVERYGLIAPIIVTGGNVLKDGMMEYLESFLGMPVKMGIARGIEGSPEYLGNPHFATASGLLRYAVERPKGDLFLEYPQDHVFPRFFTRLKEIYEEYF